MSVRSVRPAGFTLVELLLVVTIIALLLTIVVPCLSLAKVMARKRICQANLNGLAKSYLLYSSAFKGQIPPYESNRPYTAGLPTLWKFGAVAYRDSNRNPTTKDPLPFNLAIVREAGFLDREELCYCPLATHPNFKLSGYELPVNRLLRLSDN